MLPKERTCSKIQFNSNLLKIGYPAKWIVAHMFDILNSILTNFKLINFFSFEKSIFSLQWIKRRPV